MSLCYRSQGANVNFHHLKQAEHHLNSTMHAQIAADYSANIICWYTHFIDEYLQQHKCAVRCTDVPLKYWFWSNTFCDSQQVKEIGGATVTSPRRFWSVISEAESERLWLSALTAPGLWLHNHTWRANCFHCFTKQNFPVHDLWL